MTTDLSWAYSLGHMLAEHIERYGYMIYNPYFADLSSAQPSVNAHEYANAGHLLVAIKATEGTGYVNPYHRGQALSFGQVHVAVAHYHFARPDISDHPADECRHFLNTTANLLGPYDYVILDLERATPQGWSHDPLWSREWDSYLRGNSRFKAILYANRSTLEQWEGWLSGPPLRVHDADWSNAPDYAPPGYTCVFRQYTDGTVGPGPHEFAGIGRCDGNRMDSSIFNHLIAYRA